MTDKIPTCPRCGSTAYVTVTQYGVRNDHCGLWSWGKRHPLVDEATHDARKRAHAAFDPLWKDGILSRTKAYALLADKLGLTKNQCHMKLMDFKTARRVPSVVKHIMEQLLGTENE